MVTLANESTTTAKFIGSCIVQFMRGDGSPIPHLYVLSPVYYTLNHKNNTFSPSAIKFYNHFKYSCIDSLTKCKFFDTLGHVSTIATTFINNIDFIFCNFINMVSNISPTIQKMTPFTTQTTMFLHLDFGCKNDRAIQEVAKHNMITGLPPSLPQLITNSRSAYHTTLQKFLVTYFLTSLHHLKVHSSILMFSSFLYQVLDSTL